MYEEMRLENQRQNQNRKKKKYREKYGRSEELMRMREEYSKNPERQREASRQRAQNKKRDSSANLEQYTKETTFGPEFVCICCHKGLFENQVLEFNDKRKSQISPYIFKASCKPVDKSSPFNDPMGLDRKFVCKDCFKKMKKKIMPASSVMNGLHVERLPPELADLTDMENQLICLNIPFMKIRKVPKSQIEKMIDRTVLVPLEPSDVMDTLKKTLLPRTMDESAVVSIDFKRMKNMKNTHKSGGIRPVKLVKILAYIKDCKNQFYQDVIIKCLFCPREFHGDDTDVYSHIETCHLNSLQDDTDANDNEEREREIDDAENTGKI